MRRRSAGFSLVEVVVAVGVFVAGVVAAVALLGQTTRSAGARMEEATAARVAASAVALTGAESWSEAVARFAEGGDGGHADREGARMDWVEGLGAEERFFALEWVRDTSLSPGANEATAAWLAGWVEVRWPINDGRGGLVAAENQNVLRRRLVVRR